MAGGSVQAVQAARKISAATPVGIKAQAGRFPQPEPTAGAYLFLKVFNRLMFF